MIRILSEPSNLQKEESLTEVLAIWAGKGQFKFTPCNTGECRGFLEYRDGNPYSDKTWQLFEEDIEEFVKSDWLFLLSDKEGR